jgi:acyl-CoA thioester hydrolase
MFDVNLFKHKIKIKVRFSDLDAMKHVNNATYLSYIEEARIAYFSEVLNRPMNSLDFGAVIARIEIDYIQPVTLGDEIEIYTRVSKIGNKSSDVENIILVERNKKKIVAAEALTKLVSYDYDKLISKPISEEVKKKIQAFEKFV